MDSFLELFIKFNAFVHTAKFGKNKLSIKTRIRTQNEIIAISIKESVTQRYKHEFEIFVILVFANGR